MSNPVFGEGERRKVRRALGQEKDQVLVGSLLIFLILRDQATYKRSFEEIEGKKSKPSFPLCDFDLGKKALTWVKGVFIDSKPLLELFWVDSMVGFDVGRIWEGLLKKNG